jgi:SNF2 family DNA or RNA helicase
VAKTFVPHDYQYDIMDFIQRTKRCMVWASMGSGKTSATLTALEALDVVEDTYPVLVLAPLRVARKTWVDEVALWSHLAHLRVSPVLGNEKQRLAALAADAEIYTCNFDNLVWLVDTLQGRWPFKTVVVDEASRLKSFRIRQGGSRARALGKVAHTEVSRFIGLTGTPAPNGLKDLWGSVWFVDQGERLGRTFSAFEQRWFDKGYDGFSLQPRSFAQEEIQEKLKDVCLTVTGPPVDEPVEVLLYVDLPPKARRLYESMEKDFFAELESGGVEAANAAVKSNKLRQIANGFLFTEEGGWEQLHDEKVKALESVIAEASGMPVLVAYSFVPDKERILRSIPGAVAAGDDAEDRWNAGKIPVLPVHPASMGHGVSLQHGGNILVDFGVDWNLEHDAQIIERIGPRRQRQSGYERPVYRYRIVARNTIEEWGVLPRLKGKASVQDILLAALERRRRT